MTITTHLATIERICSEGPTRQEELSGLHMPGPGYSIAELQTSADYGDADGAAKEAIMAQYELDRNAVSALLTERWGNPDAVDLWSIAEQSMGGADIPEPWDSLSMHLVDVEVWRVNGHWVALGISHQDKEMPLQLLAVVSDIGLP